MAIEKRCPRCGHKEFNVDTHVVQGWRVNEYGAYTETTCECIEVTHSPADDDIWECAKCGYEAAGSKLNVTEENSNEEQKEVLDTIERQLAMSGYSVESVTESEITIRDKSADRRFRLTLEEEPG